MTRRTSTKEQLEDLFRETSLDELAALLARGADPNGRNAAGDTPLLHSLRNYHDSLLDKVEFLLARGANPNLADSSSILPVQLAPSLEVLRLLVRAGARLNVSMHRVVSRGCPLMLDFLLQNGMKTHHTGPNSIDKLLLYVRNVEQLRVLERHGPLRISKGTFVAQVSRVDKVRCVLNHAKKLSAAAAAAQLDS